MASQTKDQKEYKLYHWQSGAGRGEFIRLLFAETNTAWDEVCLSKAREEVKEIGYKGTGRAFAFPCIEHNGMKISQTPVICKYLAGKLDNGRLAPKTEEEGIQAEVLSHGVVDVVKEGEFLWHPFDFNMGHREQREKAKPMLEYYENVRLPKWLNFFHRNLQLNMECNGGKLFFVGHGLTYVDLAIFLFLEGCVELFPKIVKECDTDSRLYKFYESVKDRPNIRKWLEDKRRRKNDPLGPPCL